LQRICWTAKKIPALLVCIGRKRYRRYPNEPSGRTGQIEVRVVHVHVSDVGAALINQRVPAIAPISTGPRSIWFHELGAIVLRPADHEVRIGWMNCNTLKLSRPKSGGIDA
jgi:hypothetical protein